MSRDTKILTIPSIFCRNDIVHIKIFFLFSVIFIIFIFFYLFLILLCKAYYWFLLHNLIHMLSNIKQDYDETRGEML